MWIKSLEKDEDPVFGKIDILEPLPGTVLPPEIASIAFSWDDPAQSTAWLLTVKSGEDTYLTAVLDKPWWIPEKNLWDRLKEMSGTQELKVHIQGIGGWSGRKLLSANDTFFSFSEAALDARILFMRKPLPFLKAKQNPEMTELLVGDISFYGAPESVMAGPGSCANCHTYSSDGRVFGLDFDYGGDKGGFVLASMRPEMGLGVNDVFSWNAVPAREPATYSMGLFAQLSPDGRYLAATVNETSVFVMMDDLYFSQLFFPATGQIGFFDRESGKFGILPGADSDSMVQTAPSWSPDGRTLAFSGAATEKGLIEKVLDKMVLNESPKQTIEDLNKKYNVQFDIYSVPFNKGEGGRPCPLEGASNNGYSNYFPRYSPDGRWIVFTQSPTGLVLQKESRLCIIPAQGGKMRPLKCNLPVMNSWHSWSPNSRWLVFTCKAASPYTELFITHIDSEGESSPAVRLFRFSSKELAAMVPEMVPISGRLPRFVNLDAGPAPTVTMAVDGR
ncbi:MAG: PD40 domain-containing protein [Proteobacteria bacterium]|nr:PD40 domain-containing protein [Pseudomonadota bacterium]